MKRLPSANGDHCECLQEPFDDHAVTPRALELPMALVHPDDAESAALVERQAGGVLRKDARDELPETAVGVCLAESFEHDAAGSLAASRSRHVHGMLGNSRICRSAPICTGAGPRDHLTVAFGDKIISEVTRADVEALKSAWIARERGRNKGGYCGL